MIDICLITGDIDSCTVNVFLDVDMGKLFCKVRQTAKHWIYSEKNARNWMELAQ